MAREKIRAGKGVEPRLKQPPPEERATPAEVRVHVRAATSLVAHGLSRAEVRKQLLDLHGLDAEAADRAVAAAWSEMREHLRQPREDHRAMQLARLHAELASAQAKGQSAAVARFEDQIALLLGTRAPARVAVEVSGDERERVLNVLMMLDDAACKALLSGQRVPLGHAPAQIGDGAGGERE